MDTWRKYLKRQENPAGVNRVESIGRSRPRAALPGLAAAVVLGLTACAREEPEPPRYAASYPGEQVRTVTGTNYAAYPGLPAPPRNEEGELPPPPPRYMGSSTSASSANVGQPDVRRNVVGCMRSGWVLDVAFCE